MTDINITNLETRNHGRDWPVIVSAVECPTCEAKVGESCKSVGLHANSLLQSGQNRIDWHATRKYRAAHGWYEQQNDPQEEIPLATDIDATGAEEIVKQENESADTPETLQE